MCCLGFDFFKRATLGLRHEKEYEDGTGKTDDAIDKETAFAAQRTVNERK